jgi:hypothetical protein
MKRFFIRDVLGWGFLLWFIGYLLGFLFYAFVPAALIGWYVTPIGIAMTCLVLWKWVRVDAMRDAVLLGIGWCVIAIVLDYFLIVKLLDPPDGYYKLDVFLYYLLTLSLPVAAARVRRASNAT